MKTLTATALSFLLAAASAWGQVGQVQDGHALDANPNASGSRVNSPVSRYDFNRGNLLVTGQVGGGQSFRGYVPYSALNQYQGSLGSSSLYDFTRDSVGLPEVNRPGGYNFANPAPTYQFNSRTVFGAQGLHTSAWSGDTYRTSQSVVNPFAQPRYITTPAATAADRWLPTSRTNVAPEELGLSDLQVLRQRNLQLQQEWENQIYNATAGESATAQANATHSFNARTLPPRPEDSLAAQTRIQEGPWADALVQAQIQRDQYRMTAPADQQPGGLAPSPLAQQPPPAAQTPAAQQPQPQVTPGEDIYTDLIRQAQSLLAKEQPTPPQQPNPTPADPTSPAAQVPDPQAEPGDDGNPQPPEITVKTAEELLNLGLQYNSFASRKPGAANAQIEQAEQLIRQGRYYKAIDCLEGARGMDPANPLIFLRMSHAYVGAGEFFSAALNLDRAMDIFPSVASIRTDLVAALGSEGESFADRLAQLKRLALAGVRPDPRLFTLLCYLQYAAGRQDQAADTARFLLDKGKVEPTRNGTRLARFVLEQAKSPPVKAPTTGAPAGR
ncbi:MAG: hypothetical protein BIFFINMI_02533 [Phycisphaerae bacterium]|nr:hypothetical protein [Phycisphaerae bacterium]